MTNALATMRVDYDSPQLKDMKKVKNSLKDRREAKKRRGSATLAAAAAGLAASSAVFGPSK